MQPKMQARVALNRNGTEKIGMYEIGFWSFLMIAVGRAGELIPGLAALPMAKITLAVTLIFLAGKWKYLPKPTINAKPLTRTASWLALLSLLLTPFSFWPGASIAFLYQELSVLVAITVIAYKMSFSWRAVKGTLMTLMIAGAMLTRAALSGYSGGRAAADTMYDTNDLAYLLITVFPLAVGFAMLATTKLWKLVFAGIAGVFIIGLLLTSSRGGFLGLLAVGSLMIFLPLKPPPEEDKRVLKSRKKIKKRNLIVPIFLALAVCAVVWPQLPKDTRERLSSIVDLGNDYNLDANNKKSRGSIWRRNMAAAFERPVGYGPRAFPMVDLAHGGMMMAPHNSFVQTTVELGFIGLLLFLRMYIVSWRQLTRARVELLKTKVLTRDQREQVVFIRMLQLALVGNAVAGFFLTMAYATVLWVLFGTIMACIAVTSSPATKNSSRA